MIVPLLFAVTFHEVAHGWVAYRLGDPTAKWSGRLTLNPIKHLDPMGSFILPLMLFFFRSPIIFGYAKPVPVNFNNLANQRRDMILVAAAGRFSDQSFISHPEESGLESILASPPYTAQMIVGGTDAAINGNIFDVAEDGNGMVSQAEHTVLVLEGGNEITTLR